MRPKPYRRSGDRPTITARDRSRDGYDGSRGETLHGGDVALVRIKTSRDARDEFFRWIERVGAVCKPAEKHDEHGNYTSGQWPDWWVVMVADPAVFDRIHWELMGDRKPVIAIEHVVDVTVGHVAAGGGELTEGAKKRLRAPRDGYNPKTNHGPELPLDRVKQLDPRELDKLRKQAAKFANG